MYQLKSKYIGSSSKVQPKLKIGRPGDKYEREADRVADTVMKMNGSGVLQQQPMEEEEEMMQPKLRKQSSLMMQPLEEEEEFMQAKSNSTEQDVPAKLSQQIHTSGGGGNPLPNQTNYLMGNAIGADFSGVRIHTGSEAQQMNQELGARAFTLGNNIYFNKGEYSPDSSRGRGLLAHELTHVVQQNSASNETIQRDDLEVRSPAFEETVTQISSIEAAVHGRALYSDEISLARSVFGESIDYSQVQLIPTGLLQWRTVGNTIRVPNNFTIDDRYMAETFIHEMTHIWQYQHFGTSYISTSLVDQIVSYVQTGNNDQAYDYVIQPDMSFFEYRTEQQAMIVQTYFNLLREQADTEISPERRAIVEDQINLHQPLIEQMRGAIPRAEADTLIHRASEIMVAPGSGTSDQFLLNDEFLPQERRMAPITPFLEIRYNLGPL